MKKYKEFNKMNESLSSEVMRDIHIGDLEEFKKDYDILKNVEEKFKKNRLIKEIINVYVGITKNPYAKIILKYNDVYIKMLDHIFKNTKNINTDLIFNYIDKIDKKTIYVVKELKPFFLELKNKLDNENNDEDIWDIDDYLQNNNLDNLESEYNESLRDKIKGKSYSELEEILRQEYSKEQTDKIIDLIKNNKNFAIGNSNIVTVNGYRMKLHRFLSNIDKYINIKPKE